ncbi:MAG: putative metal-binding motif-containing protein, partial [Sandaracinaceae bacterium]|nr:putative metal-binding motif-containing protein [Sandaracinaceae bacterium]
TGCGSGGAWVMRNPATGADCNDANASARPGGTEVVGDGVDQDCDGGEICYLDNDDDGYRPPGGATLPSTDIDCTDAREARSIDPTTDCNDSAGAIRPGATEIAGDEIDQDCNGGETCYADADNDGYRPNSTATRPSSDTDCRDSGEAVSGDATGDCDDSNAAVRPGATEMTGDGVDQDCDGRETCYADADNDGYRPNGTATVASADPDCDDPGEARSGEPTTDCCDTDGNAFPGSTYFGTTTRTGCTGYDYNCDGSTTQQYPSGYSGCTYTMTCATGRGYPCSQTSGNGFVAGWGNMTGTYTYTPDTTPPSCGQTGSYVATCNPPSGVFDCGAQTYCAYQASTRTQGCR